MPRIRTHPDGAAGGKAMQFSNAELKRMYVCIDTHHKRFPGQPLNWKLILQWTQFKNRTEGQLSQKYQNLTKRNRKQRIRTYRDLMEARFPNEPLEVEEENVAADVAEGHAEEVERPSGRRTAGHVELTSPSVAHPNPKDELRAKIRQAMEKFSPLVTSEVTLTSSKMHEYLDPEKLLDPREFGSEVWNYLKGLPLAEQRQLRQKTGCLSKISADMGAIKNRFGIKVNWLRVTSAQAAEQNDLMPQRSEFRQAEPVPGPSRQMAPVPGSDVHVETPPRRSDGPEVVMIDVENQDENLQQNAEGVDLDVEMVGESVEHNIIRSRPTEDFLRERKVPAKDKSSLLPYGYPALGRFRTFTYNEWNDYLGFKNQWKLNVLSSKDWKRYAKANRLKTVKTGKQMQLDFFSTAVPNWLACKTNGVTVPALALEPGRFALIVIYHSIELASLSELTAVIQDLVQAGMLQDLAEDLAEDPAEDPEHVTWEKHFLDALEEIKDGAEYFYTTPDDYKMTKESLLGSLDE